MPPPPGNAGQSATQGSRAGPPRRQPNERWLGPDYATTGAGPGRRRACRYVVAAAASDAMPFDAQSRPARADAADRASFISIVRFPMEFAVTHHDYAARFSPPPLFSPTRHFAPSSARISLRRLFSPLSLRAAIFDFDATISFFILSRRHATRFSSRFDTSFDAHFIFFDAIFSRHFACAAFAIFFTPFTPCRQRHADKDAFASATHAAADYFSSAAIFIILPLSALCCPPCCHARLLRLATAMPATFCPLKRPLPSISLCLRLLLLFSS